MSKPEWILRPVDTYEEFPADRIAQSLAKICRYAGNTPWHYSVARHSILVSRLVPQEGDLPLLGLIHDAHEAWIGDIPLPVKQRMRLVVEELEQQHDAKLRALLGLDPDPASLAIVAAADKEACRLEMEYLGKKWSERFGLPDAARMQLSESVAKDDVVNWIEDFHWCMERRNNVSA